MVLVLLNQLTSSRCKEHETCLVCQQAFVMQKPAARTTGADSDQPSHWRFLDLVYSPWEGCQPR